VRLPKSSERRPQHLTEEDYTILIDEQRKKLKRFLEIARKDNLPEEQAQLKEMLAKLKERKKPFSQKKIQAFYYLDWRHSAYNQPLEQQLMKREKKQSSEKKQRSAVRQNSQQSEEAMKRLTGLYGSHPRGPSRDSGRAQSYGKPPKASAEIKSRLAKGYKGKTRSGAQQIVLQSMSSQSNMQGATSDEDNDYKSKL